MKFIPIPPISLQKEYARPELFALAHMLEESPTYAEHFRNLADRTFSILDNGAYEVGTYMIGPMATTALDYGFAEVILPDKLHDDVATFQLTREALRTIFHYIPELYRSKTRFMLVPQGAHPIQWAVCANMLIEEHERMFPKRPFTIGIPKVTSKFIGGRIRLLQQYLIPLLQKHPFDIHLLGIAESIAEVKLLATRFGEQIRTIDSARPFVWALNNVGISSIYEPVKYLGRPKDYFEQTLTPKQKMFAEQNVYTYERLCADDDS